MKTTHGYDRIGSKGYNTATAPSESSNSAKKPTTESVSNKKPVPTSSRVPMTGSSMG